MVHEFRKAATRMRILVATDAWHPQVNGVVRTLTMMADTAKPLGAEVSILTPQSFRTFAMPSYRDLRVALPRPAKIARLIADARPDAIHLATELRVRGFVHVVLWPRGVDTALFHPRAVDLCLPAPVFLCVGRVAVEKNLEAFLDLDLPGTKVIVGDGPARLMLAQKYPDTVFLGALHGEALAQVYAAADVFVFPSKTDTFGLVLLEALASGLPVAAFPVTGPRDVIGSAPVGALNDDLRAACLSALAISPQACLEFAARHTWEASARAFVENITDIRGVDPESDGIEFAVEEPGFVA